MAYFGVDKRYSGCARRLSACQPVLVYMAIILAKKSALQIRVGLVWHIEASLNVSPFKRMLTGQRTQNNSLRWRKARIRLSKWRTLTLYLGLGKVFHCTLFLRLRSGIQP